MKLSRHSSPERAHRYQDAGTMKRERPDEMKDEIR
jgi:hypothetical protein